MKPTFHIIEDIYNIEFRDDFIGIDNHRNYIHIPKSLLRTKQLNPKSQWFDLEDNNGEKLLYENGEIRKGIKIQGLEFPFFVLSETKKFQKSNKIKLVAFAIFQGFENYQEDCINQKILLPFPEPFEDTFEVVGFEKSSFLEYQAYQQNKADYNKLNLNQSLSEIFEYNEKKFQCLYIIFNYKIHPWFDLLNEKYNFFTVELDLDFDDYLNMICNWNISSLYAISISTLPLFTDIDKGGINKYKGTSRAKEKIMTFEKFKQLDKTFDYQSYLHQFYYLNPRDIINPKKAEEEFNWRNYVLEGSSEYKKRVYEIFKTPYVVQIAPFWHPDIDKTLLRNLHNQIERVAIVLLESGVKNLIISPPFNVINYKIEEARLIEKSESDYYEQLDGNFMDEFNNQGLREIDDQDEGWWRIANDID